VIKPGEIQNKARDIGVRDQQIEKDYILSWILQGIAQHSTLSKTIVFKGGTVLKKIYFEDYRFSEDLDFTLLDDAITNAQIFEWFTEVFEHIKEEANIPLEIIDDNEHQDGGINFYISYVGPLGRILGIVQDVDYPRFDNGFHISTFNSAATNHTLAHEIGHLIGLQHQIEQQPLTQTITDDYAHAFQRIKTNNSGGVKKGMWTNVCTRAGAIKEKNTLRLDNYSSPNVTTKECFSGTTTIGNQNIANNAMQIGWHGCELANLYPNNVSVASWLEGPSVVCPGQPAIFELKRNCTGFISNVTWEYSYTGFQWNTFNGGSTFNLSVAQYVPGEMLFIRATFSLNGTIHHTSISSEIDIFASPCVVLYKKEPDNQTNKVDDMVVFFPNPSKGITTIQITSDNNKVYNNQSINVFDLFGRKVGSFKINMPNPGITETKIDLTSYRKGMYIAIINGNRYVLEKI